MNDLKLPSNRNFGIVFFVFFLFIFIYLFIKNENLITWPLVASLFFLSLGLLNSKILTPFNKIWFKFGFLLGKVVSPLVMGIIFFLVVTPTSFLMKIFKKDLLNLRFNNEKSYWIEKSEPTNSMKNQF